MNERKEIKLESSLDEMFKVEQFVEEISDEYLLYGNYFGNILIALTEAVQNAMIHGNGLNTHKHVGITLESTKEGLWIGVNDQGAGFDYRSYSSGTEPENDSAQGNNGLFLIHRLADEVRFQNNGRTIEMLFRINGIEDGIFARRMTLMQDFFRVYHRLST